MKLSLLVGAAIGYVLGARAGHERYDEIVRMARKVLGSQTVQVTAGVLQAHADDLKKRVVGRVADTLHQTRASEGGSAANGHLRSRPQP